MASMSLIMIIALRSVSLGLLSPIPNCPPAGMVLGIWGFGCADGDGLECGGGDDHGHSRR